MGRVRPNDAAKGVAVSIDTGPFTINGETASELKAGR